jgi:predicted ATPase/DNA-binding XRE family transcriptional regulator
MDMARRDEGRHQFGHLLRQARRAAGLTQEELAARAGLSTRGISDLERGERRAPHRETLQLLADALDLSETERLAWERARRRRASAAEPSLGLPARDHPPPRLPRPLSTLVGREREIREIAALLRDSEHRLLTVTGPGGIGKTRVGIAVAHAVTATFPGGIVFVDFSAIRDPALALTAIASTLGARETGGREPLALLGSLIADRRLLLILDSCEHVVDAAPEIVALLAACPRLQVLATSRAPLHVSGEREYVLPPLQVPGQAEDMDPWRARQSEAVELFLLRARAARSGFDLTQANAHLVAEMCRRLDGLPLALELAAARIKILPPEIMLERLEEPLEFLTGGARDLPARQRTMRDTIRWSYQLLDAEEQTLLRALSAFVGGWTLAAAEIVGHVGPTRRAVVLDELAALVDHSLVIQLPAPAGGARYGFLETVREFGLESLGEYGERGSAFDRHARHIVALAESIEPGLRDQRQRESLRLLTLEQGNFRAVLRRSLVDGEVDVALGRRLAVALIWFWFIQNQFREAHGWLELATADLAGPPDSIWARAAVGLAMMRWRLGDAHAALPLAQAAWDALDRGEERWHALFALHQLAHLIDETGDPQRAIALFRESVAGYQELGDPWGVAAGRSCTGRTLAMCGRADEAGEELEQAFSALHALGDEWSTATAAQRLADLHFARGDCHESASWYCRSIALFAALADEIGIADGCVRLGLICAELGQPARAARLLGAAEAIHEVYGMPMFAPLRGEYSAAVAAVINALGEQLFTEQWEQGRRMPSDSVVAYACEPADTRAPSNS